MAALEASQRTAIRWTFLGSGMTHPSVTATIQHLSPSAVQRVHSAATTYCR